MYQKKRIRQKKQFIKIIIILILLVFIYVANKQMNDTKIELFFKDIGASIQNFLTPTMKINDEKIINQLNQELKEENEELKQMLNLPLERYRIISASVIRRDISWYHELTISKGKKDHIEENMAVISNGSLIGKIITVTNHSSTVRLLTSSMENMKVAVTIQGEKESYHGILNGYLADDHLLRVTAVAKNSEIKIGDQVYTNGLGGIYPNGLYIGDVFSMNTDSLGIEKVIYIKINSNYDKLRYVMVVGKEL